MKKYFWLLLFLSITCSAIAQPNKKPAPKEKPPTQKEMEDLMKEAQKAMGEMSPEDKKMMDSMGIKMPSFNNVPKVSDKQLADAWEDENRIVPKKDDARIAGISKAPLTRSSVGSFIASMHNYTVPLLMPASKTLGEKIYAELKSEGIKSNGIGNIAVGLWITGHVEPALYVMGRACTEDAANDDNINNYASMISMSGAEEKAIPLLNYLNALYPQNSTILNNLGQAWFGLGDMTKAEKYLDSTIRLYAYHPQANVSKSMIQESKGDHAGAAESMRNSMHYTYSKDKEDRLRKLGSKLTSKDVNLPGKTKLDPLNLGGSTPPPFPMSVDECIAMEPVWKSYREQLEKEAAKQQSIVKQQGNLAVERQKQMINDNMAIINASRAAGSPQGNLIGGPVYAVRAALKLKDATDEYIRKMKVHAEEVKKFATGKGAQLEAAYKEEMRILHEADNEQTGEGKPNKDFCPRYKEASDKFLKAYNSEVEPFFKEELEITKNYYNESAHWKMFIVWPEQFEAEKAGLKMGWLGALSGGSPAPFKSITDYKCNTAPGKKGEGKLSEFDDVACQYHSETDFIFAEFKADCSRFTTTVSAKFIKLGMKQNMDKDNFADQFMSGNAEVKFGVGGDKVKLGPLKVGVKAEAGMGIEFDRNGVNDVYVTGAVKANAGVGPAGIKAGFEGQMSLISGTGTFKGTGTFARGKK